MATGLYDYGRNLFARGELHWKASGGDNIKAFLVDTASYTPDLAAHDFLDDIPAGARAGNAGGQTRADAPALTLLDPSAGICDANNITFTNVPTGGPYEAIVLFKDDSTADSSSPLIAYIDNATGLPVTTNGGNITVEWSDLTNKIFKL